jgi:hypothetical protein
MASLSAEKDVVEDISFIRESVSEMRKDISLMKNKMVDIDTVLMDDDIEALKASDLDLKAGKTKRL